MTFNLDYTVVQIKSLITRRKVLRLHFLHAVREAYFITEVNAAMKGQRKP